MAYDASSTTSSLTTPKPHTPATMVLFQFLQYRRCLGVYVAYAGLLMECSSWGCVRLASPHSSLSWNVWGLGLKYSTFSKRSFLTIQNKVTPLPPTNIPTLSLILISLFLVCLKHLRPSNITLIYCLLVPCLFVSSTKMYTVDSRCPIKSHSLLYLRCLVLYLGTERWIWM